MKTTILIGAVLLSACGSQEATQRDATARADTAARPAPAAGIPMLPDSMRHRGACPFECCVYGEWKAVSAIPLHRQARSGDVASYSIPAGTRFQADSGFVFITGLAMVVVEDTIRQGYENRVFLLPNDTVVLLDYLGEGHYNVWRRGEVLEEFQLQGRQVGEYAREWWVHVTHEHRRGWIWMDSVQVAGSDACSGPVE